MLGAPLAAATSTWTGAGGDGLWSNAANWDVAPVAGSDLVFTGSTTPQPVNDVAAGTSFASLTISTGGFAITGNGITLTGGITVQAGTGSIGCNLVVAAVRTVTVASGASLTLGGVISGAGGITKAGDGTLTLGHAANTYTGATTLSAGTLAVGTLANGGTASGIGQSTGAAANLVLGGGTLAYTGATVTTSRAYTLAAGTTTTISVPTGVSLTLSGAAAATTGALAKSGPGTLVLAANNGFSGGATIRAGTLASSGNANAFGTGAITLGDSGGAEDATLRGGFNGTHPNAITVAGGNTGTVRIGASVSTATFSGAVTLAGHDLVLAPSANLALSGGITGTGNLVLAATGTATIALSGAGVNMAGTVTNSGTSSGTATLSGPVGANVTAITQGSTTSATTVSGALTVNAGGTTLANTAGTRVLTVSGGVGGVGDLVLANHSATASGVTLSTASVNPTGTVTNSGSGSGTATLSATVGANVTGVTQSSATSTLVLSGANVAFTGVATVAAGTLRLGHADALGTVAGGTVVQAGGSLDCNGVTPSLAEPLSLAGTGISGGGALTNNANTAATWNGGVTLAAAASVVVPSVTPATPLTIAGPIDGGAFLLTTSVASGKTLILSGGLGGSGGLTTGGAGTTRITAASPAYAAPVTMNAGVLRLDHGDALGGSDGPSLTLAAGTLALRSDGAGNDGVVVFGNPVQATGTVSISVDRIAANTGNTLTLGALTVASGQTLTITNGNGYRLAVGDTTLTGATLRCHSPAVMYIEGAYTDSSATTITSHTASNTGATVPADGLVFRTGRSTTVDATFTTFVSTASPGLSAAGGGTVVGMRGQFRTDQASNNGVVIVTTGATVRFEAGSLIDNDLDGTNSRPFRVRGDGTGTMELASGFVAAQSATGNWTSMRIGEATWTTRADAGLPTSFLNFQTGSGGVWRVIDQAQSFAGSIDVFTTGTIHTETDLALGGDLTFSAAFTKSGPGTLTLDGTAADNDGAATVTVTDGVLLLARGGRIAIPAALTIGDGAGGDTVRLGAAEQIADTATVTVAASGTLDLDDHSETVADLVGAGLVDFGNGTANTFTVGSAATTTFAGAFVGTGAADRLVKQGAGTWILAGDSSACSVPLSVTAGVLQVDGQVGGAITVTARLTGTGSTGALTVASNGTVAPGTATPGTLSCSAATIVGRLEVGLAAPGSGSLLAVAGDLVASGTIDVVDAGGFGAGVYTIATYGGSLDGDGFAIGSLPAGFGAYVDTSVANQVRLVVSDAARYWIGGSGSAWHDAANWSTTSGGAGGAGVPDAATRVFLDAGSGAPCALGADATAFALDCTGYTGTLSDGGHTLAVTTNTTLSPGMTLIASGALRVGAGTLISAGQVLERLDHGAGTLVLGDDLVTRAGGTLAGSVQWNAVTWTFAPLAPGTWDFSATTLGGIAAAGRLRTAGAACTVLIGGNTALPRLDVEVDTTLIGTGQDLTPIAGIDLAAGTTLTLDGITYALASPGTMPGTWGPGARIAGTGLLSWQIGAPDVLPTLADLRFDIDLRLPQGNGGSLDIPDGQSFGGDLIARADDVTTTVALLGDAAVAGDCILDADPRSGTGALRLSPGPAGTRLAIAGDLRYVQASGSGAGGSGTHTLNHLARDGDVEVLGDIDLAETRGTLAVDLAGGTWTGRGAVIDLSGVDTLTAGTSTLVLGGATALTSGGQQLHRLRLAPGTDATASLTDAADAASLDIGQDAAATLAGASLTLRSGALTRAAGAGAGVHTIGCPLTLGAAGAITASGGGRLDLTGGISGAAGLAIDGGGTVRIAGTNPLAGATAVLGGTLRLDGTLSASPVEVAAGGTLAGGGTAGAGIAIADGGTLAPGVAGAGTLATTTLGLAGNAVLAMDLGTASDAVAASGAVGLGGHLDVAAGAGFGAGTYTLITCAGTPSGTIAVRSMPSGYVGTIVVAAGRVDLVVTVPVVRIEWAAGTLDGDGVAPATATSDVPWTPTGVTAGGAPVDTVGGPPTCAIVNAGECALDLTITASATGLVQVVGSPGLDEFGLAVSTTGAAPFAAVPPAPATASLVSGLGVAASVPIDLQLTPPASLSSTSVPLAITVAIVATPH